jgi:hypothetical protein
MDLARVDRIADYSTEAKSPPADHCKDRMNRQILVGRPKKSHILWCFKEGGTLPPLTSILSPHKRRKRKKGTGQLTIKINWFSVSVLKILFFRIIGENFD